MMDAHRSSSMVQPMQGSTRWQVPLTASTSRH